jgi:hypothetical protein
MVTAHRQCVSGAVARARGLPLSGPVTRRRRRSSNVFPWGLVILLLAFALPAGPARAQEMEPRSYSNSPLGTRFFLASYSRSNGSLSFDSGQSAKILGLLPYAKGTVDGVVAGTPASAQRNGFADPKVRLAVNFLGAPALSPAEFASYAQDWILGGTVELSLPMGAYRTDRVVNIGNNRWSLRSELGASVRRGDWILETSGSATFYTDNDRFRSTSTFEQDPLYIAQAHLVYEFRKGVWLAGDAVYSFGGRTTLDGVRKNDRQERTRFGVTLAVPISKGHALKFAFSSGATSRLGVDFDTLAIAYQRVWLE